MERGTDNKTEQEILALANNEKSKEELITQKDFPDIYLGWEVKNYDLSMEVINRTLGKIECLRKVGDYYYGVFETINGGWEYLLFSYNSKYQEYIASDEWYFKEPIYKADYEKLKVNKSTLQDVRNFNPVVADAYFYTSSPCTVDYTYDGYRVEIEYDDRYVKEKSTYKDYYISKITIEPVGEDTVLHNLLPIDKLPKRPAIGKPFVQALSLPVLIGWAFLIKNRVKEIKAERVSGTKEKTKVKISPKTALGKWSIILSVVFLTISVLCSNVSNIPMIFYFSEQPLSLACLILGLIAVFKKDKAILLLVPIILGLVGFTWILTDILFPGGFSGKPIYLLVYDALFFGA